MMAISGKKQKRPRGKKIVEGRLSNLPDKLLLRILSFLNFVDVLCTREISKRWRDLWKVVPYLNFSSDRFYEHVGGHTHQFQFWNFVCRALERIECKVRRVSLSSDETTTERLNGLLHVAPFNNVDELCLLDGDYVNDRLNLPQEICERLTSLTIDFHNSIPLQAQAPFSRLKSLYLRGVVILADVARKLLSNASVFLENVYLEGCNFIDYETYHISSKNIQKLTILNMYCFGNTWIVGPFNFSLHISTPNLVSFSYIGPMLTNITLSNTTTLKDVLFRIIRVPLQRRYDIGIRREIISPCHTNTVFAGFCHAKVLTISSRVVKYMSPELLGKLWFTCYMGSFTLDHLNCLKVGLRYNVHCIEGLISLLKRAPNLEALVIRFREDPLYSWRPTDKKGGVVSWKSRIEDIACLSQHLKKIDISGFDGSYIAIALVKFLLRNAKVLEKADINMCRSRDRSWRLFNKLADKLSRASPKAVVTFSGYAQREFPWFQGGDSDPEDD